MKKLNVKSIKFNEQFLSVLKYFTLLDKGTYTLKDFQALRKEIKDLGYDKDIHTCFGKHQELAIISDLERKIELLTKLSR